LQFYFIEFSYLLASIFFILGLKGMSHPETAKRGMHLAEIGMLMAIIGTLMHHEIITYTWILAGLAIGSVVGLAMGVWVPMTAMPQRTALSHAFGAFAAALVGIAEFSKHGGHLEAVMMGVGDALRVRHVEVLERVRERHRRVRGGHHLDGCPQCAEGFPGGQRRDAQARERPPRRAVRR
jgi:NAD/NADP transhydrogenase beta subunit